MWPFSNTPPTQSRVDTDKVVPVHLLDDATSFRSMMVRQLLRFDEVLDVDKLRSSLLRLLNRPDWRRIGARVRLNSEGKLEQHIPAYYDDQRLPVLFTHQSHAEALADHPLASQLPGSTARLAMMGDVRNFDPIMRGPNAPKKFSEHLYRDIPQIAVHIHSFEDATLVSVSWAHTLSDLPGMAFILQAWQAVLEGRDDEVPMLNDAEVDLLEGVEKVPVERHYLSKYMMKPWQVALLVCNLLISWVWYRGEEQRIIYIPGDWLLKVHAKATDVFQSVAPNDVPDFLSRNDVVCAVSQGWMSNNPELCKASGMVTVGNFCVGNFTRLSARGVKTESIGEIAASLRQTTNNHRKGDQMDALTSIWRHGARVGNSMILGQRNMHMVTCVNWARGSSYQLDFSAARTSSIGKGKPLKPSMALPFIDMENSLFGLPIFWFTGPDETGGYWITGSMSRFGWERADDVFAKASC